MTDDYQLRPVSVAIVGPGGGLAMQRRPEDSLQPADAAPWDPTLGTPPPVPRPELRPQRRYKPKTIFDLLFGN